MSRVPAGLPSRGAEVFVQFRGSRLLGRVDGYSVRLGAPGQLLWLEETPGLLTRVPIEEIEDWGHVRP